MNDPQPEHPDNVPVTRDWSQKNEVLRRKAKERRRGGFIFYESKLVCWRVDDSVGGRGDDSVGEEEEGCEAFL